MGKANRERRRHKEKERKRQQQTRPRPAESPWAWSPFPQPPAPPSPEELAERLVAEAVHAQFHADESEVERCVTTLTERRGLSGWERTVDRTLLANLQLCVTTAWRNGWQPADVVRMAAREYGKGHVRLAVDAIAAEMRSYAAATVDERWQAQLSALDVRVWWERDEELLREGDDRLAMITRVVQVLGMLAGLPRMKRLMPLPGTARRVRRMPGRAVDERTLARVRALLAKAESTDFPAEAETFTSAAQSLMARHSIDTAMLAAESGGQDEPEGRRLGIDAPYEAPKAVLLDVVASANRCRAVWSSDLGFSTVLGFVSDLDAVELLFTSLLVQATSAMVQAGRGQPRIRSFRQSFLAAYAQRIGERLREATGEAVQQVTAETGRDLLPVLAVRERAVDEAVNVMFPELIQRGVGSVNNADGWISGRAAADLASLHPQAKLV